MPMNYSNAEPKPPKIPKRPWIWWIWFQLIYKFLPAKNTHQYILHSFKHHIYFFLPAKGQVISKGFFGVFNFFQKTNENTSHSSKNEFILRFLEEFTAWQFAFEINWPLADRFFVPSTPSFWLAIRICVFSFKITYGGGQQHKNMYQIL